jgi:hypothetical protein
MLPPTRFAVEFNFVLQDAQIKKAKDFLTDELHTRAVQVRETKEAVESAKAGLSPQEGDVKKERRKRPRKATRSGREKN